MNKILTTVLLSLLTALYSLGQTGGKVYDNLSHKSTILNVTKNYAIYLPSDYETSERTYPALYLLHGSGDTHEAWIQFGEVKRIADAAIANGAATPMIIVMPNADSPKRGYENQITGDWNYEDYFFNELMPHVEFEYRIKKQKRYRAISGNSMGGAGAYMYVMHRPDLFASACPLSAGFRFPTLEEFKENHKDQGISEEKFADYYKSTDAFKVLENTSLEDANSIRWYIDCGDDDFLYEGNSLMHIAMKKAEIKHEYRVRGGSHNWGYWRESLPEVLRYVSEGFHK